MAEQAIAALGGERRIVVSVSPPENQQPAKTRAELPLKLPVYKMGEQHATRKA
jgi:hypothetical protein